MNISSSANLIQSTGKKFPRGKCIKYLLDITSPKNKNI